jgi:hypothetical protein
VQRRKRLRLLPKLLLLQLLLPKLPLLHLPLKQLLLKLPLLLPLLRKRPSNLALARYLTKGRVGCKACSPFLFWGGSISVAVRSIGLLVRRY